jgi:hypothetical protein
MAQLGQFDPDAVPDSERDLVPPGQYIAQIVESDLASTKSGGTMLKLSLEIVDGPLARRMVWDQLNIENANVQAQQIAHQSLKKICKAVGHQGVLADSNDLHFKPMLIRVAIREDKTGQYGPQNQIKSYDPVQGAHVSPPQQNAAPTYQSPARQQQAASGGMPWKR